MKKWSLGLSMLAFFCLLFLPLARIHAEASQLPDIRLILEGKQLNPDVPPKIIKGRTMVPIRVVAEGFGAEVGWEPKQKKINIVNESINLSMEIGKQTAIVNGKEVAMDVPPMVDKGRTIVPLRFVGESLGTTVGWDSDTRSVVVNQVYSLEAKGLDLGKAKVYRMLEGIYIPLEPIRSLLGVTVKASEEGVSDQLIYKDALVDLEQQGKAMWNVKKMDGKWYIPQASLSQEFGLTLDITENRIHLGKKIETEQQKIGELLLIEQMDKRIIIHTSLPVVPQHFMMDNPHRIVIDLPNAILSEKLRNPQELKNGLGLIKNSLRAMSSDHLLTPPIEKDLNSQEISEEDVTEVPTDMFVEETMSQKEDEVTATAINDNPIKEIRYSQFSLEPKTVRVVVELANHTKYSLRESREGLEIVFQPIPKKEGFLVVLDPGHGGTDPGAKGISGNSEKDLTLAVYKLLKEELKQYKGIQVIETREEDTYPTLPERVQLANGVEADLFLSIHANSFKPQTRGTETFYFTSQSEDFAKVIHEHLLEATGFPDRGVKKSGFYVIKNTVMPSALIEIGFLTNAEENAEMLKPEFQAKVAKAISEAIFEYYTSYK